MRRITIYADEADARKTTAWLEEQGLDYMSEDFAEPTLTRRPPPVRRAPPERSEEQAGFLSPTKKPQARAKKPGRKLGAVSEFILAVLKDTGGSSTSYLIELARDNKGWKPKKVRDTLRRLEASGRIQQWSPGVWGPEGA